MILIAEEGQELEVAAGQLIHLQEAPSPPPTA
jgi:hypothetical protein